MTGQQQSAGISVRHLAGSAMAGTTSSFDQDTVLIGRGTDNDIAFDAHADRQVSTRHARLTLRQGRVMIADLGSTNHTFVNGVQVTTEQAVNPGDVVRLGESGPELMVFAGEADANAIPATIAPSRRPAVPHAPPPSPPRSPVGPGGQIRVPIGGGSGGGSVTNQSSPRRKGGLKAVFTVVLLLALGGVGYAVYSGRIDVNDFDFAPARADNERSVYLIAVELERKDSGVVIEPIGTAWAVEDGVLATNAHVVEGVAELLEKYKGRAFARSNTDEIVDLPIESWDIHPGYERFTEWMVRYAGDRVQREGGLPNPFDVGVFRIKQAQADLMEAPLALANESTLFGIRQGSEVTTVGFPMEGLLGGGTDSSRPVASFRRGSLDKMTDAFLGRGDVEDSIMLSYQFEITGGASGSPVFDTRGRVIGLVAAGNVVGKTERGRVAVGGTTLGPRVDVLKELLDGVAQQKMDERESDWPRRFEHWGKD